MVSSLLHLKEILSIITTGRMPLEGFAEKHRKLFEILFEEAVYLYETAQNARENLISLIDLYINTTSYEMNKVMRVIAVITCLAVIPTLVGGLFGMNLIDNPWNVRLWQVVIIVATAMLGSAWVFYKLGWFKS